MKFLLDEMLPPNTAAILRDRYDHDAVHVSEVGLRGTEDATIASVARDESHALVTENVGDFARERDLVLVFVRKRNLPAGDAQAPALAALLNRWAADHPEPYVGPHWPS